eukprot:CAMPEP_0202710436 /NCGR_PEP_ID=MMETSP1385-20130828/22423_1 /ASSEMBLY_ACC=CAM_ASM_000861 /TAXON_ID=933848 /ORGANISM="Elphidium margaritaceum" /LENGTH=333 /DNA_ID=CAMNT_0049369979 /DNA_START=21 /DNA_END=1019 /DNA_ORIENTATION=+
MNSLLSRVACTSNARIGVIGVGNVGAAVCNNLLNKQYNLATVYDHYKSDINLGENVQVCSSVSDAVKNADIVITALPKPENIRDLVLNQQLFEQMEDSAVWVDHSTTDYFQTVQFAKDAKDRFNIETLECPITGGVTLLKQGLMTMYVGGNRSIFDACAPYLQCSSNNVIYMGEIGTATITKITSNMLATVNTVAMGEALMIAKRTGVDLEQFWHAIRYSAGNTFVWETEAPLVFNGTYDTEFAVELQCKDMKLGNDLCQQYQIPTPMHTLAQQIYNTAQYQYGKDAPSTIPVKLVEDALNEPLQVPKKFDEWSYSIDTSGNKVTVIHKFGEE